MGFSYPDSSSGGCKSLNYEFDRFLLNKKYIKNKWGIMTQKYYKFFWGKVSQQTSSVLGGKPHEATSNRIEIPLAPQS